MKGVSFLPGALIASALIGVLVAVAGLAFAGVADPGDGWTTLAFAPVVLIFAVPIGFVVAILPNLAGAALLAWLGRGNIGARLPVFWALAGAGAGWAIGWGFDDRSDSAFPAVMAVIGAASALLCRWRTRWE